MGGVNKQKKYDVSAFEREELLRAMLQDEGLHNVDVAVCGGYIWRFAQDQNVSIMYRGIRSWSKDGAAEKWLELLNVTGQLFLGRHWPIPTAYLFADPQLVDLS